MIESGVLGKWGPHMPINGVNCFWEVERNGPTTLLAFKQRDRVLARIGYNDSYWLQVFCEKMLEKKWLLKYCVFCAVIFVVSEDFKSEVGPTFAKYRWKTQ